jgi:hypothetical protein
MIFLDSEQGVPQWFQDRAGAITASMVATARKKLKSGENKGDYTTAGHNYAFKLAVERIKGGPVDDDQFVTWAMRRGTELEHDARRVHEKHLGGVFIEQAGVCLTDDRKFGYSTDGFIGDDGMAEYKCFLDGSKVREILFSSSTTDVIDQVQTGLWITGREWCDFGLYYPDLSSIGLDLIVQRMERNEEYIEEMVEDLLAFDGLVEDYMLRIRGLASLETTTEPEIEIDLGNIF